ncbi:Phosphate ABC transporter substrate-binding protein [Fragilaria crotonensis]|nr:Phosphate ABC transporter substrate-binding protein [Fragilaria crotonensis]
MMILRTTVAAFVLGAATAQPAGCGSSGFRLAGSSTVYPVAVAWGRGYATKCGKATTIGEDVSNLPAAANDNVVVVGGGSGQGATRVCNGGVEIGTMSREWRATEATSDDAWNFRCVSAGNRLVTRVEVAIDGITVVVKRGGPGSTCIGFLRGLTPDQLRFMYSSLTRQQLIQGGWSASSLSAGKGGDSPLWSTLDKRCEDKEFNLSGPDQSNSGTSEFFKEKILKNTAELFDNTGALGYKGFVSDGDTLSYVRNNDAAIGFFGYSYYFSNAGVVLAAPIRNRLNVYVAPSKATILSNEYNPLTRRIFMNVNKASLAQTLPFLEYGYTAAGDKLVEDTGNDAVPAADQILMLSRLGSASGIKIADIVCETNGIVRVGTGNAAQRARFNAWSLLYTAKCPKVDVILSSIAPAATANGQALSRTCATGVNSLEVGATSALADNSVYKVTDKDYVLSCPSPSVKKLIELVVSPGVFAYVNNAAAVLPISRGFLRFCLSPQGTTLLGKLSLTANTLAVNNDMLNNRIVKPGGFCFSGSNTAEVKGRGEVAMRDLAIGDMVKVSGGKFSEIYSFGHYEHDVEASFLSIDAGLEKPLVLSGDHMVFVDNKAVAASTLAVGDKLSLVSGFATVKMIKAVTDVGVFAPFTKDGTIVVNSVVASSYVNLKGEDSLLIGGIFAFDLHWLAHLSQAPHRLVCEISSSFCASETYSKGVSVWVETPLAVSLWLVKQNPVVMTVVFVPAFSVVFLAAAVEALISSPALLLILVATAFIMSSKTKKSA